MIVSHIEIKTGCIGETFQVKEHVLNLGNRIRLPLNPFVQLSEIRDEPDCFILLGDNEYWGSPFTMVDSLEHT